MWISSLGRRPTPKDPYLKQVVEQAEVSAYVRRTVLVSFGLMVRTIVVSVLVVALGVWFIVQLAHGVPPDHLPLRLLGLGP